MERDYFLYSDPLPSRLQGMTQERWNSLSEAQRKAMRDESHLTPQLAGLEGWRVRVVDMAGEVRKFIVGRSTGWRPCHLEIGRANACCGNPARSKYQAVEPLERVR